MLSVVVGAPGGRACVAVPLWPSRPVARIASRVIALEYRGRCEGAWLALSAHTRRPTAGTNRSRSGADVVLVAEIAGHRRLDTTRRYSLPSAADRDAALEAILVEI